MNCFGSTTDPTIDQVSTNAGGELTVTFEWSAESIQTSKMLVWIKPPGRDATTIEGSSPLVLKLAVTQATDVQMGTMPTGPVVAGPVHQSVTWKAELN